MSDPNTFIQVKISVNSFRLNYSYFAFDYSFFVDCSAVFNLLSMQPSFFRIQPKSQLATTKAKENKYQKKTKSR